MTDEEKDVEQEIKNTEVDSQDVSEELSKIVFDQVLKLRKLRHEATKHDYSVTRKLDDRIFGREYELALHIISPFHPDFEKVDEAKMYVAATEIESGREEPTTRIHDGFDRLVDHFYPNLRMLRGIVYTEAMIPSCLHGDDGLFANDATTMSEAESEVLSFISRNLQKGIRTSIRAVTDTFEIRPYGWPLPAVLCNLAKLCGRGKLEARSDSEVLEEKELWDAITNTRIHGNVLLEPQIEFTQGQVRRLKEFYEQFFDSSPKSTKAKALGAETVSGFELMRHELKLLIARSSQFPFLSSLADHDGQFTCFAKKSYKWFFTEFEAESETLLDLKENVLDPIRKFMSGPQANLYADANAFLESNSPNFSYLDGTEVEKIKSLLADPKCYVSNAAQQIKQLHDSLKAKLLKKTTEETQVASAAIQSKADRIQSIEGYSLLSADQQSEIRTTFTNAIAAISSQPLIAVVRETVRNFETVAYQKLLTKVGEWTAKPDPKPIEPSTVSKPGVDPIPRKVVQYHSIPPLHVAYDRAWLASPSDIDEYLAAMKASMLKVVRDGDRVQV